MKGDCLLGIEVKNSCVFERQSKVIVGFEEGRKAIKFREIKPFAALLSKHLNYVIHPLRPTHYEDHVIQEILRDTCSGYF